LSISFSRFTECKHQPAEAVDFRRLAVVLICALAPVLPSCVRKSETSTFVARVNNEYLTPEKVKGSLDSTGGTTDPQVREFVTQWVNSALLYEEAKAQGLDRSVQVNETLEEMRRQLAVNRLLETEVYKDQGFKITDEDVKAYYDQHKDAYLLTEPLAKIRFVVFADKDVALRFRGQLAKGKTWDESLQSLSGDSSIAGTILGRVDSEYVKQSATESAEFWEAVKQLHAGDFSQVANGAVGYFVANLLEMQRAGEIADFPSVATESRERVLIDKRRNALSGFLERLKKKYAVQVNLPALESVDTMRAGK
jgi:peptidyl-prolyl cis-trans isomerase C